MAAAPKPNEALAYLRSTAKAYAILIPGASATIDATFDAIDELHNAHREEVDVIIYNTYDDIKKLASSGSVDLNTTLAILGAIQQRVVELSIIANKVHSKAIPAILDSHESKNTYIAQILKFIREKSEESNKPVEVPKEFGFWDLVKMVPGGQQVSICVVLYRSLI